MCRGNIDSFFFLDGFEGGSASSTPGVTEEVDYSNMTWSERFEHWNNRLN
jgi:hypothetical protein